MSSEKESIYYERVVLRCQRNEKDAFEELIRNWEKRLFYYVRRLVDDEQDAWDILQQTWLKVIQGIGSLREPRSLPTWLYRIARGTAMDHWRDKYSRRDLVHQNETISNVDHESEMFRFEDAEQVHYGLNHISLPHREVLTLYFLEDFSVEEIAKVLGIPPGTVKSRLYYAKRDLRSVLEQGDGDNE